PNIYDALGGKGRIEVRGTLNGTEFANAIVPRGGIHFILVNKALQEAAGVAAGSRVRVTLEAAAGEREASLPDDLAAALAKSAKARAAFEALSPFRRRELVKSIESAKKEETRRRRLDDAVQSLTRS
ncbi:MAG TPA: YdeI/OmpD-associated family protein, partial [Thermoanaerobaculia bacterium]|nr:YdeI/OmpD-associated family protein [Thermoanaerobaculia bacterium]